MTDESVIPDRDPADDADQPAGTEPSQHRLPGDPEVPEADALEQADEVAAGPWRVSPSRNPEVPEADAWDQAHEVPLDDEESAERE